MVLGSDRAWVVHGADGIDEMSTTGYTKISEGANGGVRTFYLDPTEVGLTRSEPGSLGGGTALENAGIIAAVLDGERGPARDVVVLNAGAALFIAGEADSIEDGMSRASAALDRKAARQTLDRLVALSVAEESVAGAGA
jgi:anthranilate phosphoribosyltransferase